MAHPTGTGSPLLWTLAGGGRESLAAGARELRAYLAGHDDWSPRDIAFTLAHRAAEGSRRAALVAQDRDGFLERLDALAHGRSMPGLVEGTGGPHRRVAFVFSGQGAQWPRMAVDLLDTSTVFRDRMDACAQALEPFIDWSLTDALRDPDAPDAPAADRADVVQPVLFAVTVSLAALWRSHGVEPDAVLGHSVGEITAAEVSGALSLDDAARVVALWSQAQATLAGQGDMVSVMAPVDEVAPRLERWDGRLVVAALNGPRSVIVSGDRDAAAELLAELASDAVHARRIAVGLAAHSPQIDTIVPRMRADLAPIRPRTPNLPYYSALTGGRLDVPVLDADYWCRNLRGTVRFQQAAEALLRDGHDVLLEVSPHTVMTAALTDTAREHGSRAAVLGTLRRDQGGPGRFLTSLGELYVRGVTPDREALSAGQRAQLRELPLAALAEPGPADMTPSGDGDGQRDDGVAFHAELVSMDASEQRAALARLVAGEIAALTGRSDPVPGDVAFLDLGFDSVTAVELRNRLSAATTLRIPATAVFDCPTPDALAEYLRAELVGDRPDRDTDTVVPARARDDDPVAIVSMGCRYPGGVSSPDELWELVSAGADAVSPLPADRGWDTAGRYDPAPGTPGRYYQREAGSLADATEFDAEFFGISPREALAMDPQQRLLLETAWEVLERAGIDPATLRRTRTGVFVGAMTMDYGPRLEQGADAGGHLLTGNTGSVASGRLAYTLGLEGAAVTVDTACSSSLVALHLAVRALRSGECTLALAGGATVMSTVGMLVEFSRQGGLAPDGRCKAFAAVADGFGLAEGVGMLLVERLSDARRLGHPVLAVVRGSATNQDGASNGLTAPNGPSQQRVIRAALADAGLAASEVDMVEAHGTGTRLGDPIEAQALLATYGQGRPAERPVWIGSLKSNIGHAQAAAGVGGVIKSVLALRHGVMPKTLHVDGPTPEVDWSAGAAELLTEARAWEDTGRPRRAGVSSFGISGTNAHVIVESAPVGTPAVPVADAQRPGAVVWPLSGRDGAALRGQAAALHARVLAEPGLDVADVGHSLAVGRSRFAERAVVVGSDRDELLAGLAALSRGLPAAGVVTGAGGVVSGRSVLVFPGQGSQWVGMAAGLLDGSVVFAGRMAECERALAPYVDWSLTEVLRGSGVLARVDVVQPALWAVMVSLAEVWRSFGVVPDAVVGHSQGEIAAAVVAGGLSLEDGARVVALRSRAVGALAGRGGMASVPLPVDEVRERIASWDGGLSVAAVNGPSSTVVSGDADAVAELVEQLVQEGIRARRIEVDYASHSAHVEDVREQLLSDLAGIAPVTGSVPFFSTVTGGWLDTASLDASYWFRNLRETVRFGEATRALLGEGFRFFVEPSAHPVLAVAVGESVEAAGVEAAVLGTLRRGEGGLERLLLALGDAYAQGAPVDWEHLYAGTGARRVELPTYAFQRRRYWLTAPALVPASPAEDRWDDLELQDPARLAEALGVGRAALDEVLPALETWRRTRTRERRADSWRYHVAWSPLPIAPVDGLVGRWLALRPEGDAAAAVLDTLGDAGADLLQCVVADPGTSREQLASLLTKEVGEQPIAGVLSLLSWEERTHPEHPDLPGGPALTLALAQALEDAGIGAPLWTLTRGTAVLGGSERPGHVGQAASAALGRTLALEHPHRWGGSVDLPEVLDARAARRLCAVLAGAAADEDQVAVRSTGVHGRRLRPAAPAPPKARTDDPAAQVPPGTDWHGTVLVTGGTGGVGSHTARWLAGQGAERLLLVSRRGAGAPGADELREELTALGVEVAFAACDVADRATLAELVADIPARYPLSAVVHAAGVLDDGVLDALDPARLAAVLRAKLTAARNLHEVTAGLDLSAFVVFSSVMGVVGSAGQGNYAAANAAVDALVAARRATGLPGTAVAWGAWAGRGMLVDGVAERLRDFGMPVMEPESAVTAIGRALAEDDALVLVADVDWRRFAAGMGLRSGALLDGIPAPGTATAVPDPAAARSAPDAGSAGTLRQQIAVLPRHEDRVRTLTELVRTHAAAVLRHPDAGTVRPAVAFSALGFDSLTAVELRNRLAAATGLALPATVLFDHPTPSALAGRLLAELGLPDPTGGSAASAGAEGNGVGESGRDEPIAIVGMGCRFPGGVERPEDFWRLLSEGTDAVGDWPSNRGWDTEGLYDPDPDRAGTTYSRQGGFLHDAPGFDAEFFGISPREALAMDPQQRLLLETAWEAVEGAGQDPTVLKDRQVGVYIGTNGQDYSALLEGAEGISEGHLLTGNTASVLSGRLSYVLGLQGPSLTVDTACSSSLVAVHLAVQALRRGDCEQALAGGVTVMSTPKLFVEFSRQRGLAADGRCKAFSAEADGTGWGEGAGVLLLERHRDALRHGHPVLALISGTAVNQDGASNGLTAPNGPSQQQVIRAALADAGLRADQIDAVEAHGTGTRLGDPIEAQALQAVHGPQRPADRPLWLGSVKSNIGHTQAAAGVAGVMKMVLAIRHGELPGTLHAGAPNPHVDWSGGEVRLLTGRTPWPETGGPRRAGVSSFGISGTNAHAIIEQAPVTAVVPTPDRTDGPAVPPADPTDPVRPAAEPADVPPVPPSNPAAPATTATVPAGRTGPPVPLLLSARTPEALRAQAERLRARLDADPDVELADVAYSLATGRAPLEHRAAVLGRDPASVRRSLTALARGTAAGPLLTGGAGRPGRTAFLFPGQGSQRAGAGAELYRDDPVFATALDEVLTGLDPHLDRPLRDILFAAPGTPGAELLERTRYTQPALFALETALFRLVQHWGVRPDLLMGHSIGELAAAHAAGVLDLPDACALVAARGRLMDALPGGGAMTAVEATEEEARQALLDDRAGSAAAGRGTDRDTVDIAAVNGPTSVVLSGDGDAVRRLAGAFRSLGRRTRTLNVSHAFHSARMEGMLDEFRDMAESLTYHAPGIEIVSNLTGRTATADELRSPDHWVRHVRGTVRFLEGARRLRAEGATAFLELGPGGVLSAMAHSCLPDPGECATVPLLRDGRAETDAVRTALASLHLRGVPVDWSAGWTGTDVRRVDLPTYAFQRRRFWPEAALDPVPASWRSRRASATAAGLHRYHVDWQPLTAPVSTRLSGRWLLVTPDGPGAEDTALACEQALAGHGADVVVIRVGAATTRAELASVLPEFGTLTGVLSLLGLAEGTHPRLDTLDACLTGTLLLLQALGDSGIDAPLWCATRGAVAADGTETARPEQAQIWGLGRVAALEHPRRWGGLVDLPEPLDEPALDGLCAVLAGLDGEDQVALRAPGPLGRRLVRARTPATPAATPWTPRGTVLVTGGTGGLGAQVARWLAERGAEHLVLLSRRGPEAPGAAGLVAALAEFGARSTVLACDVADRGALERILERLRDEDDTVRAVVHTAGLTTDTAITDCALEELAERTAAKTRGAAHLDALLEGHELDAFVLFSSISATWGSGGQGVYAAANAYLDGLAAARRGRGLTATSVAWGPWSGAGMAVGAVGDGLRRHGLVPMAPATALAALGLALELDEGQPVVAEVDWSRFAPTFGSVRESALLRGLPTAPPPPAADAPAGPGADGDPSWRLRLERLSVPEGRKLLRELVRSEAAAVLGHESAGGFAADRPFREVGFDSLTAVELRNRLVAATGLPLPLTSVFDHPTAVELGAHLFAGLSDTDAATADGPAVSVPGPMASDEPLAIVSMACRFPGGVRSPDDLWRLVADGVDAVAALPADRGWPLDTLYDPDPLNPGTFYTTGGGFLDGAAEFDAEFFGISPREALAMDPQQRLLLETSWEALERAGLDPASVRGSEGGVYVGVAAQGYGTGPQNPSDEVEGHLLSGNVTSVASGRVAYTLGLGGPAVTVETACSSSLVALHLAGQALRAGDCSFALVGGAAVMASPDVFVEFSRQQGLSPDGRCRSFAEEANGTGWGEGVGVLLVERLSDARRLGHPVLALVRGTAVNQDGASNGLTAPSGPAQQRVIRTALATAGVSGAEVDLVEAHGTGTVLGDPIEAQALLATYGQDRPADRPLWLGSLKSNIGHTQAAAGVAGVIKTVLALRHGQLPRTLHAQEASSRVDWSAGAVRLLARTRPWDAPDGDRPRRAGVSAFGMSGTNAHAILEEAPATGSAPPPEDVSDGPSEHAATKVPWLLSAMTPAALRRQARRLAEQLRANPGQNAAEAARALTTTRPALPCRAAATGRDRAGLLNWLDALVAGEPAPDAVRDRVRGGPTAFVFPGQGSQWAGMAVEALTASPAFADAIAACGRALAPYTDWSLTEVLRGAPGAPTLDRVDVVQPVLFAVMVALAAHWRDSGITPDAVVGHSQGEIAAACVAGALSLDDAALVVALRSRALLRLAGRGGMVSVAASAERTTSLLPDGGRVHVAAVNGPDAVVVAGEPEDLSALLAACAREGLRARAIPVDYAAHSAQVAEIEDELRGALTGIRPRASAVPLYSTVTGEPVAGESLDAAYWYRNLREPVDFVGATRTLLEAGHTLFVEVSPHPVLLAGIEAVAGDTGREVSAVGTLRRGDGGRDRLLAALTEAWVSGGGPVDWSPWTEASGPDATPPLPLPTYPFQRDRYWLPTPGRTGTPAAVATAAEPVGTTDEYDEAPAARLAARLAPLDRQARRQAVLDLVTGHAAAVLGHTGTGPVRPERSFSEVGFDSMLAVRFRNRLGEATGLPLPPTLVFDHPTPAALAAHLDAELSATSEPPSPLLAELDRLAALLAAVPPGEADADGVGERLNELLRGWGQRAAPTGGKAPPPGPVDDTATATADELFALLDNNFGTA